LGTGFPGPSLLKGAKKNQKGGKIYQIPNLDIFIFIFYIVTKMGYYPISQKLPGKNFRVIFPLF
jgi:hypothetical protein